MVSAGEGPSKKVSAADLARGFASRPGDYQGYPPTVDGTVDSVEPGGDTVIFAGYKDASGKIFNVTCMVGTRIADIRAKCEKGSPYGRQKGQRA